MSANFFDPRTCPTCDESACFLADPSTGNVCCSSCGYIDESATHRNLSIDHASNGWGISDPYDAQAGSSKGDDGPEEQAFKNSVKSLIKDWLSTLAHLKRLDTDLSSFVEPAMRWYLKIRHAELLEGQKRRSKALEKRRKRAAELEQSEPGPSRIIHYARSFHAVKIPYHVAAAIRLALQESHLIVLYARIERALGEEEAVRSKPEGLGSWAEGGGKAPVFSLHELFDSAQYVPGDLSARLTSLPFLRASYRRFAKLLGSHMSSQDAVLCNVIDHMEWIRSLMTMTFEDRIALFRSTETFANGREKTRASVWKEEDFAYFEGLTWDDLLPLAYKLWRAQSCVNLWSGVAHRGNPVHNYSIALICWCITAIRRKPMKGKKGMPPIAQELAALYEATFYSTVAKFNEMQKFLVCWASSIPDVLDDATGQPIAFPAMEVVATSRAQENEAGTGFSGFKNDARRQIPEFHIAALVASTVAEHWQQIATIRQRRPAVIPIEDEMMTVRKLVGQHAIPAKPKRTKAPKGSGPKAKKEAKERAELDRSSVDTATSLEVTTPVMATSPIPYTTPGKSVSDKGTRYEHSSPQSALADIDPPTPPRNHPSLYPPSHRSASPPHRLPVANTRNFWAGSITTSLEDLIRNPEDSSDEELADSDDDEASITRNRRPAGRPAGSVGAGFSLGPTGLQKLEMVIDPQLITPNLPAGASPAGMRIRPTPRVRIQPPPASIAMSRSGSSSSSHSFQTGASEFTSYSATTLHSIGSAFPSSSRTSRAGSAATEASIRPASEYVPKDPFAGCLARERDQYYIKRVPKAEAALNKSAKQLHTLMEQWVREQRSNGSIPHRITPAYLAELGLPSSPTPSDVCLWAGRMKKERGWSACEAWLRTGRPPSDIPPYQMATSVTALRADLYRLGELLQPEGIPLTDEELDEEMQILFDQCGEDDPADTQILTEEEAQHREWIYAQSGTLDKLIAASEKATARVIQQEEEAARAASQAIENGAKGRKGRKRKRKTGDLAGRSMLEGWDEPFIKDMDDGEAGVEEGSLAWYTGGSLLSLMEMSGEGQLGVEKNKSGKKAKRSSGFDVDDDVMAGLQAFEDEKEDDYGSYWGEEKVDEGPMEVEKKKPKRSHKKTKTEK